MGAFLTFHGDGYKKDTIQLENHEKDICEENCIENNLLKRCLYSTNTEFQYYLGQLGIDYFFDYVYLDVCGVDFCYYESCDFIWNKLRNYLKSDYLNLHTNILCSEYGFGDTKINCLRVVVVFDEEIDEQDFQTFSEIERLVNFGKLAGKILQYPTRDKQLFCTIAEGDMYTSTFMKFPFMTKVFDELNLCTRSAQMSTTEARLTSCRRLQEEETYDASVEDFALNMADAGLYLTTNIIFAQCFECGGLVSLGKCDYDPWYLHAKYHPCCPYVIKIKGQDYVDSVRRECKKEVKLQPRCILQFNNQKHGPAITNDNFDDDDNWTDGSDCSDYFSDDE